MTMDHGTHTPSSECQYDYPDEPRGSTSQLDFALPTIIAQIALHRSPEVYFLTGIYQLIHIGLVHVWWEFEQNLPRKYF